ncbi:MAG: hypothetical protein QM655_15430 [Nocardioidaceae bacterium]
MFDVTRELQAGVITRGQILALGGGDHDIRRLVRRRELVRIHRSVYLDHTGTPSWIQRAWAAVLQYAPAALAGTSAIHAAEGFDASCDGPIMILIAETRRATPQPGIRLIRRTSFEDDGQWNASPPRERYESALLTVAIQKPTEYDRFAVLADAVQRRRTTPERLLRTLAERPRVPGRKLLTTALHDIADGSYSVLEREYAARVERAHGLPKARRQARADLRGRVVFRDATYDQGVVVELDGRAGHTRVADIARDLDRDILTTIAGVVTVRLVWRHVLHEPCMTAARIAELLIARGWAGRPVPCSPTCPVGDRWQQ